ncbi:MAG: prepilin-type N-terminal cleavage/methylation domain-containing protein [Caldithrix sp.]|nr:prepilin-type N-terminal cleavage/methylation domain-containing protein [Caldithrix sp.]
MKPHSIKSNQGYTLVELIVAIVILGVALPAFISLVGKISMNASNSMAIDQAVTIAEQSMEEIIGFKDSNWDWYKTVSQFQGIDTVSNDFTRSVTINNLNNWGNANVDAWRVVVQVNHPQLQNPYEIELRLTKFYEEN